jgi:DNA-binding transcriptional LysR family regulator
VFVGIGKQITEKLGISKYIIPQEQIKAGHSKTLETEKIKIDALREEKFILLNKGSKMRQMAKQMFDELRMIPNVTMEYECEETAIRFCEEGFGICFVSEKTVRFSDICRGIDLFLPSTDYSNFDLYLIRKKSRYLPEAIREFTKLLQVHLDQ